MELTDIKSFYVVAINKNISKSAKILNISQPALSKRLKEIESSFDKPLLLRSNKGIELTEAGRLVYDYCQKIMELTHQLDLNISTNVNNVISFAITSSIINDDFHNIIKDFKNSHKYTEINIQVEPCKKITQMLLNNEIEFGIIQQIDQHKDLNYVHLSTTELALLTNVNNDIKDKISIYEILKIPIILPFDNSHIIEKLKRELKKQNLNFSDMNILYQTNSLKIILSSLMEENIYTILPKSCVKKELDLHKLKIITPIENINFTCDFALVTKKQKKSSFEYQSFIDYLIEAYRKL